MFHHKDLELVLLEKQVDSLLAEYASLRQEYVSISMGIITFGFFLVTTVLAAFGFAVQTGQHAIFVGVPWVGLSFAHQMLRMQVSARYVRIHLRRLEARLNRLLKAQIVTWHSTFEPTLVSVSRSEQNPWVQLIRTQPVNVLANVIFVGSLVAASLAGIAFGVRWIDGLRDVAPFLRGLGIGALVAVYALWGSFILWEFLTNDKRETAALNAYLEVALGATTGRHPLQR